MLWPDSVVLNGVSVPLAGILADLVIHHGRETVADDPTATTCQITLRDVSSAFVGDFEVGQTMAVTVRDGAAPAFPRFTGRITDAQLVDDDLTIIAAGEVSRLRNYVIGEVSWPAETWSARVTRAFTEGGLAARLDLDVDPDFNPLLVARDPVTAGPTTLGDYAAFLAAQVGALIADKPNGDIRVQALGARTLDDAFDLDPADVQYAPAWVEELPGGNVITVRYTGDQSESVTVTDAVSVAMYGERPATIDTTFQNSTDATYRANLRLGRSAFPHWNIPSAPVLRGLDLEVGQPIILAGMPAASPFEPWTPILEGWQDEIRGDTWTMLLSLSDPLLSGVAMPWATVPATSSYLWNTIDGATDWTEALTLESLDA